MKVRKRARDKEEKKKLRSGERLQRMRIISDKRFLKAQDKNESKGGKEKLNNLLFHMDDTTMMGA